MNILLITVIYALVAAIDLYSVRRDGKGIIAFHTICLIGSFTMLVLSDMGVSISGPSYWIYSLVRAISWPPV